jgi:hypothetical protein
VKNLRESVENAERMGLKVTQKMVQENGSGFAYLDSDRIGGVIIELIQWPSKKP